MWNPHPSLTPTPTPAGPNGGQLWQTAVASADRELRSLHASHGRLSHLLLFFFIVAVVCRSTERPFTVVLPWVNGVAEKKEKKTTTKVCESCLQTLWWICSSSLSHYCLCYDFIQEAFLSQQFVLSSFFFCQLKCLSSFFSYFMRCQESNVVSFLLLINDVLILLPRCTQCDRWDFKLKGL